MTTNQETLINTSLVVSTAFIGSRPKKPMIWGLVAFWVVKRMNNMHTTIQNSMISMPFDSKMNNHMIIHKKTSQNLLKFINFIKMQNWNYSKHWSWFFESCIGFSFWVFSSPWFSCWFLFYFICTFLLFIDFHSFYYTFFLYLSFTLLSFFQAHIFRFGKALWT